MPEKGLKELYIDELKDLYNAEDQLVKALPKMAKAAASEELRSGLKEHLEQTRGHVSRLEGIFTSLGENPKGKKCTGMEGLIEEGSELIDEDLDDSVNDAGLIGAAQRVEHYEIAAYGQSKRSPTRWATPSRCLYWRKHWRKKRKPTRSSRTSRNRSMCKPVRQRSGSQRESGKKANGLHRCCLNVAWRRPAHSSGLIYCLPPARQSSMGWFLNAFYGSRRRDSQAETKRATVHL